MSCTTGDRAFIAAPLIGRRDLGSSIFIHDYEWIGPKALPGQFFLLKAERSRVLLGRPISVLAQDAKKLSFLIARRGEGTEDLENMQLGEKAELIGPLGNSWLSAATLSALALPSASSTNAPGEPSAQDTVATRSLPIALVGGGIGVAPLSFLASTLTPKSYNFYAGFRSLPFGLESLQANKLLVATEDGSEGQKGRIPDFLDTSSYSAVYACGPEPMLRAVALACATSQTACYLSLERRMACGVGACLGCTVATIKGNKRCCVDGPVFDAKELLFDE